MSITTETDNKFCDIFLNFEKKKSNDNSWESSAKRRFPWNIMPYLLFLPHVGRSFTAHSVPWQCRIAYLNQQQQQHFWKSGKIWNCRLLQIIGGALKVKSTIVWNKDKVAKILTVKDNNLNYLSIFCLAFPWFTLVGPCVVIKRNMVIGKWIKSPRGGVLLRWPLPKMN